MSPCKDTTYNKFRKADQKLGQRPDPLTLGCGNRLTEN